MTVAPALRPEIADESDSTLLSLFDSVATALLDAPTRPDRSTSSPIPRKLPLSPTAAAHSPSVCVMLPT